jgi:hypothetical protein
LAHPLINRCKRPEMPKIASYKQKPTSCEMGFARTLFYQGFRLGESFSTASQPAKTLVIGYYGLGRYFVKSKKTASISTT